MRVFNAELGALQLELAINFRAGQAIGKDIGDPLMILRETIAEQAAEKVGIRYQPKFAWTIENIPLTIWYGARETQPDLKLSAVQEACVEVGLIEARAVADGFVAKFLVAQSQQKAEAKVEAKAEAKDAAPGE